jgi:hypothetical protein
VRTISTRPAADLGATRTSPQIASVGALLAFALPVLAALAATNPVAAAAGVLVWRFPATAPYAVVSAGRSAR